MKYLQSKVTDEDDYFCGSIICITEENAQGAVGFIVNRAHPRSLNDLQEFAFLPLFRLYEGGPVDQDHLYFIHRRPDIIDKGVRVSTDVYLGGNFKQATAAIAKGKLTTNDIRIFTGYCGWDSGELEKEIKNGDWDVMEADVFS